MRKLTLKIKCQAWEKHEMTYSEGQEEDFLNFIKDINQKHIANIILNGKTLKAPPLKSKYPLALLLSLTALQVTDKAIHQEETRIKL